MITIHTGVNARTEDYVKYMVDSHMSAALKPDEINLVKHRIPDVSKGSGGHVKWLREAISAIKKTPITELNIHVIADADTVMLEKGWDRTVQRMFVFERTSMFGTSYEDIGTHLNGNVQLQCYQNLPNLTWAAFSPFLDWTDLDPGHNIGSFLDVDTEEKSKIYGLPMGHKVLSDIGWRVPQYLTDKNRFDDAMSLHHVPTTVDPRFPNPEFKVFSTSIQHYCEEYHLRGKPFLAHQRGSSNREFKKDPLSAQFYNDCEDYLKGSASSCTSVGQVTP